MYVILDCNDKAFKAFKKDFDKEMKSMPKDKVAQVVKPATVIRVVEYVERFQISWESAL